MVFLVKCTFSPHCDTLTLTIKKNEPMPRELLIVLLLTIGSFLFLVGYFWIGFHALRNDPGYGKWAFLSGVYRINYCRGNWSRTKIPCSATILGMILILIGIII
jgi:hypothetical protein